MISSPSGKAKEVRQSLLSSHDSDPVSASPLAWNDSPAGHRSFAGSSGASLQRWSALGGEEAADGDAFDASLLGGKTPGIDKSATGVVSTQEATPPSSMVQSNLPTSFTFPDTFSAARSLHQELQNAIVKTPGTGSWSPPVSIDGDEAWVIADEWGDEAQETDVQEVVTDYSVESGITKPSKNKAAEPVPFFKTNIFTGIIFVVAFIVTAILGTFSMGLTWVDVTICVTFFATQIALIQPSCFPFLIALGRPWSMLAGAAFMILLSDLESEEAFEAIDMNTLALLFGASLISANLEACQLQQDLIDSLAKDSASTMIMKLSLMAMAMSWIITNDGSALIISPVALRTLRRRPELPKLPIMLAVSSAANIGSALLLSGNPQNILVDEFSRSSGLTFASYMLWALVPTALCMMVNTALLVFFLNKGYPLFCCCTQKKKIDEAETDKLLPSESIVSKSSSSCGSSFVASADPKAMKNYRNLIGMSVVCMIVCFFIPNVLAGIGWVTTSIAILITCMYPLFTGKGAGDLLALVDYELLLLFTGLFVVTGGMTETGLMDKLWAAIQPHDPYDPTMMVDQGVFIGFVTALSNSVGNVPAVLLLENAMGQATDPKLAWEATAWFSTIAGNFTLLGSAANVIVAAAAARAGVILTYGGYLKFGFFSTILCMLIGFIWMNVLIMIQS